MSMESSSRWLGPATDLFSFICLCIASYLDMMAPKVTSMSGAVGSGNETQTIGSVGLTASASQYLAGLLTCHEMCTWLWPLPRVFVPRTILANA